MTYPGLRAVPHCGTRFALRGVLATAIIAHCFGLLVLASSRTESCIHKEHGEFGVVIRLLIGASNPRLATELSGRARR